MNKKNRNKKIGQLISNWRVLKNMSRNELSQKANISVDQLKDLETGSDGLNIATFLQCLDGLGIHFNEFFEIHQVA